jgi:hypothetical protein
VGEATLPELVSRHRLFEAARCSAGWTVQQLWVDYLALGGTLRVFDVEHYLGGGLPIPSGQQDVLACALNERLTDLSDATRVPYLTVLSDRCEEALNLLQRGPDPARPTLQHQQEERTGTPEPCRPGRELIFEQI